MVGRKPPLGAPNPHLIDVGMPPKLMDTGPPLAMNPSWPAVSLNAAGHGSQGAGEIRIRFQKAAGVVQVAARQTS